MGSLATLLSVLKGKETITSFTLMAASGCSREMGPKNEGAAQTQPRARMRNSWRIQEKNARPVIAGNRTALAARIVGCLLFAELFFHLWRRCSPLWGKHWLHPVSKERVALQMKLDKCYLSIPFRGKMAVVQPTSRSSPSIGTSKLWPECRSSSMDLFQLKFFWCLWSSKMGEPCGKHF